MERRDDLSVERVTLYNQLGEYEKAKSLIASRKFHPWEGGEGKISGQYIICRIELAKKAIAEKRYQDGVSWETRRKLEAVSISLSIMGNSISSTM